VLDALPQPVREDFAGGVFEARHFVQIKVVQLRPERFERVGEPGVIHYPAELWVALSRDSYLYLEAVPVQPPAFM